MSLAHWRCSKKNVSLRKLFLLAQTEYFCWIRCQTLVNTRHPVTHRGQNQLFCLLVLLKQPRGEVYLEFLDLTSGILAFTAKYSNSTFRTSLLSPWLILRLSCWHGLNGNNLTFLTVLCRKLNHFSFRNHVVSSSGFISQSNRTNGE